jgi:hypothetical protein
MNVKKIVLILLLVFSIASLVTIVVFARYRIGIFGSWFDRYAKTRVTEIGRVIDGNLENVQKEVRAFADDGLTRSIFIGSALGENTERFVNDAQKIKAGVQDCDKIQAIDREGKILFSTDPREINAIRVRAPVFDRITNALFTNHDPFLYFMNSNQMVVFDNYRNIDSTNRIDGLVALYYQTAKLYTGIYGLRRTTVPASFDKFVFLSSRPIDPKDISRIVDFAESGKSAPEPKKKSSTFGSWANVRGVRVVYDGSRERFFPIQGIVFLVINFLLLGTVIYTLSRVLNEESLQTGEFTLNKAEVKESRGNGKEEGIGTLVKDIEEDRTFAEGYANRGIEEMIMSHDMDLTTMPDSISETAEETADNVYSYTGEEIPKDEEGNVKLDADVGSGISFESEDFQPIGGEPETVVISDENLGINHEPISEETLEAANRKIEPSEATSFFAESDRILSGAGELPEETSIVLPEEEPVIMIPTENEINAAVQETHQFYDDELTVDEETKSSTLETENNPFESAEDIGEINLESEPIVIEESRDSLVIPIENENAGLTETIDLDEIRSNMISPEDKLIINEEERESVATDEVASDEVDLENMDTDNIRLTTDEVNSEEFNLDTILPGEELPVLKGEDEIPVASGEESELSLETDANGLEGLETLSDDFMSEKPSDHEISLEESSLKEPSGLDDQVFEVPEENFASLEEPVLPETGEAESQKINIPGNIGENVADAGILEPTMNEPLIAEEDETISIPLEELPAIENETFQENIVEETPVVAEPLAPAAAKTPIKKEAIDFSKVFSEPPVRMNSLSTVEDYADAVVNLAKTNQHMDRIYILEKKDNHFRSIKNDGLATADVRMDENDPVFRSVISKQKSIAISGDLANSRYVAELLPQSDISDIEELFMVPVVKDDNIRAVAMYARKQGTEAATNIQKYELYNIGFLHD